MNIADREFYALVREVKSMSEEELAGRMRAGLLALPSETVRGLSDFFCRFGYWGSLRPERGDFTEIALSAASLSRHIDDYARLYERLADVRSKRTLFSVLSCRMRYDFAAATATRETLFPDYFDPDILPCTAGEVMVDLGAYVGDTVASYLSVYGVDCYSKIYCYEITPAVFAELERNLAPFPRIETRRKGVLDRPGRMTVASCPASASANTLSQEDPAGESVEVTTLDLDIAEPVTLIKADIEGAEYAALLGAARHLREERPRLALSVYHGHDDLWRIPLLVDALAPGYTFRLRHRGSPLFPTEITLFAT